MILKPTVYILHDILYLNFIAKGKYFTSNIQCIYTLSNIAAIRIKKNTISSYKILFGKKDVYEFSSEYGECDTFR